MLSEAGGRIRPNPKAIGAPMGQTTSALLEKYQLLGIGQMAGASYCKGWRPMQMTHPTVLAAADLEKLKAFDSCTISNAIESFNVRPRNEGFVSADIRCQFPELPPMVGYAATARIRTSSPPMSRRCYYDRMDWWNYVASLPEPRVMVLQDADHEPGVGAFVGEIHAAIGRALNCVGCVTNGAVRDLPSVEALGFQLYARRTSVSHAYAHIIDFGEPVEIDGLKVLSGDLLHGDRHGVVTIPQSIAAQIPETASTILRQERALIEFCHSARFSLRELAEQMKGISPNCDLPWRDH
jgi:regulator of RNase E activity RraA